MPDYQDIIDSVLKETKLPEGTVTTLSAGALKGIPVLRTGIPNLDIALGVGGLPKGRIIEVFGPESSGKTTLVLSVIARTQEGGGKCAIVDVENSLDPQWAKSCGINIDNLIISQPDTGEDGLSIVDSLVGKVDVIAVDSVSALVPRAELEGVMGQAHVGLQARMMGQAMRKLSGKVKKTETTLIFINQIRHKVGVIWGSNETTSGGNALKFFSSVRLDIRRTGSNKTGSKDTEEVVSNKIRVKVVKNKVAPPFKICNMELDFKHGFDIYTNMFDALVSDKIITKKGSWFSWDGDELGQGKEASLQWFRDNVNNEQIKEMYEDYVDNTLSPPTPKKKKKKKKKKK